MFRLIPLIIISSLFLGCAAAYKPVGELKKNVKSVAFIQETREPIHLNFGVVDTSSFWAAYGGGVSSNLGGSALAESAAAGGQSDVMKRRAEERKIMLGLLDNNNLTSKMANYFMPLYAAKWGVPYKNKSLYVSKNVIDQKDGYLQGMTSKADTLMVFRLASLQLTEKVTFGSALAAGFTLGTSEKDVTAEGMISFRVFQKEPQTGKFKLTRVDSCMIRNTSMDNSFPFKDVVKSKEKAKILWDEYMSKSKQICSDVINQIQ